MTFKGTSNLFINHLNSNTMLTRIYDTYLHIRITMNDKFEFEQIFTSDWKLKDALSWMYDTYLIDDDKVIEQTCSYVKRYKIKSNEK